VMRQSVLACVCVCVLQRQPQPQGVSVERRAHGGRQTKNTDTMPISPGPVISQGLHMAVHGSTWLHMALLCVNGYREDRTIRSMPMIVDD
jgi:hypothetical protein